MKKFNAQKALAHLLLVGLITTAIFPGTAYAAEVGEQMAEGQQTVMEAVASEKEQQDLVTENTDQAQNEPMQENGQTEDAASSPTVTEYTSADQVLDASAVAGEDTGRRLILTADTLPEEIYEANNVEHYDDLYLLTYETKEACAFAYDAFVSAGYVVEKDDLLDAIDQDEIPETKVQDEVTAETIDDPVPTVGTKQTLVAVIDTGISDVTNDDVFKDRIIEGTSVLSDSYLDDNGHGTAMAKIIAEDTAEEPDVMILPIKALDENGKGTVLSIALAIKYAKEHGADVINLSLSGVGQSNVLTNAINDCYNNGITVVTAAGNDNADAKDYIPGNVDTAINVAAVDKDTDGKIVSATYTNHGDNVDFAALGIYHLSVDKDEVSLETELRGTSIASAHVTAYVAMLKQINAEVSETDVMESLKASATDLGEKGIDPYFGNGFLAKENLVFLNSDVEDQDKEIDVPETDTDGDQNISTANYWDGNGIWHITTEEGFNGAVNYANSIGPISVVLDTTFAVWGNYVISGSAMSINGNGNAISFHGNGEKIISINQDLSMANIVLDGWNCSSSGNTSYTVGLSKMNGNLYVDNVTFQGFGNGRSNSYNAIGLRAIYGANVHANRCKFNDISSYGLCIDCSKDPFWILSNDDALPATGTITNCSASGCGKGMSTIRQATFDTCSATNCDIGISLGASQKWFSNPCVTGNLTATAKNCTVSNCTTTGISGGYNAIVTGCTVSGCDNGIGMGGRNGDTVKISSNTVYNCTYGLNTWSPDLNCSNNTFRNNTEGVLVQGATTYENSKITPKTSVSNTNIYSNKYGIDNKGTLYFKSGNVYSNTYGGRNYGTLHMSGGSIYSNTYDGLANMGTLNLTGGAIKSNTNGIRNGQQENNTIKNGTLNMSGGQISNNTLDGIYNRYGTATVKGGTIKDNKRYGTNNLATMNYVGGASGGNAGYDIYQNGNYKMSGSASTYSNGVFLAKGKIIEITGPLTCTDGAIKVTIQRLDSTVGRTVAKCTYGMNKANADAMLGKFALQNKETRTIGADGKTFRKAALRSATGTNGSIGNIVLSEKYYVTYDGNVQNAHVTFDLPARQTIYWKEDADVPTVGTTAYYDGRVFQSLRNIGYSKTTDGSGAACGVGQTMHFAANEVTKDQVLYALYTTAADLAINGNTQTAGDDYVIHGFVSNETALPDNTFEKIYSGIEYDENLEKDIPYKTVYSHHGWSYSDQAMYKDSGVGKCGETFDLTPRILEMLQQGQESVSEEGYINNLTLYAVWDEPPKITAMNKYWNTDAIRAGKLNKEDLLRTASAKDKEDGTDVTLEVEDFDIEKFLHLGEYGWMSVRYKATDGAGNVSYKLIKVVVVQSGIVQGEFYDPNPAYVRMIDRENYNKKSHEEGGLMEDSVWYTIPTYKKTILDAFDRLDNGEAIVRYHFSCKDIREAQAYETEAMENGTYPTAAHWEAWLKKFEHCKVFDTGYRSSKELNNSINPEDYEDYEESEE